MAADKPRPLLQNSLVHCANHLRIMLLISFFSLQGDSGGPLVVQREDQGYILSGIVSWGIRCENFAVFTRVSEFRDWISEYVQF